MRKGSPTQIHRGRRQFIYGAAVTAGSMMLGRDAVAAGTLALPPLPDTVVDTHTHFYDPSRQGGVPWPQPNSPLFRTVLPDDWRALANPCGVTHTVVVEASAWVEDNAWILELAEKDKSIVGFVGNLDPMDTAFETNLIRFAANPLYRGIRVSGKNFFQNAGSDTFMKGMKKLASLGLSLDVNGPHPTLEVAATLARTVTDLRIIVDHIGNAGDPKEVKDDWKQGMKAVGSCANIFCKVSGVPEQSKSDWGKARTDLDYYRPLLEWVWNSFGEDRLIYGSNWPVSDKGASYAGMFALVRGYFAEKGETASRKYFSENSKRAYQWLVR